MSWSKLSVTLNDRGFLWLLSWLHFIRINIKGHLTYRHVSILLHVRKVQKTFHKCPLQRRKWVVSSLQNREFLIPARKNRGHRDCSYKAFQSVLYLRKSFRVTHHCSYKNATFTANFERRYDVRKELKDSMMASVQQYTTYWSRHSLVVSVLAY